MVLAESEVSSLRDPGSAVDSVTGALNKKKLRAKMRKRFNKQRPVGRDYADVANEALGKGPYAHRSKTPSQVSRR